MKLFNIWDTSKIKVSEEALVPYINLRPILVPRTGGRSAQGSRIWAPKIHIVERLMNKLMVPGHRGKKHKISSYHCTGKANLQYKTVISTLKIIEKVTGKNPIEVFVTAIVNAAPREEVLGIEYGGARYSKPVEVAPQRRVDLVLKLMVQGAYGKSFNSRVDIEKALSEEILAAYNMDVQKSNALSKKLDNERQADSSR
ncbi:30S ribosomal protein S7 [archaeon]|jgi:small subunit ribosomal protein S7|nr:30S ribosomal protein S7 [archaeon]